jgi:hypothetical protein
MGRLATAKPEGLAEPQLTSSSRHKARGDKKYGQRAFFNRSLTHAGVYVRYTIQEEEKKY